LDEQSLAHNIAVKEAQSYRKDIFSYAPRSNATTDYRDLIEELEEGNE
jgi:cellulose biosynthesis protein BcsQ